MKARTKVLLAAVGFVAGSSAVLASGGFNWASYSPSGTKSFTTEHWDGAHTVLKATRGAVDVVHNTMPVSARVTIDTTGVLTAMSIQSGNDANGNGTIEPTEWTTVATGNIVEQNGKTTGIVAATTVSTTLDAFRVVTNRTDIGNVWDVFYNGAVQIEY